MASYILKIRDPNGATQELQFEAAKVTIGRRKADIMIEDTMVSTRHAELLFEDGVLTFVDVGSSNGSYDASGRRLGVNEAVELALGTTLRLGGSAIQVVEIEADEVAERTSMLTAAQIQEVLGNRGRPVDDPRDRAPQLAPARPAPAPEYRPTPERPAPAPVRNEPPFEARRPHPAPQPVRGYPAPKPPPEDDGMVPVAGNSDWGAPPSRGAPPGRASAPPAYEDADAEEEDEDQDGGASDWASAAAKGASPVKLGKPSPAAAKGGGSSRASAPKRGSSPRPPADGPLEDPPPIEDEAPAAAATLLPAAIKESLELVKGWKNGPQVGMPAIQEAVAGAWDLLAPNLTTAPIPLLAVSGALAVFGLLMVLIPGLAGIFGILVTVLSLANLFAYSATAVSLIGARVGLVITPVEAVQRVIREPIPIFVSFLLAGLVAVIGAIALIIPGIALGAFLMPAYWIEGRRNVGLNGRSLDFFRKDGRRIILVLVAFGAAAAVVNIVINMVLGFIPVVGIYLMILVGAAISALQGAFGIALTLWLYFDIRARRETGDAEAEARSALEG